MRTVLILTTFDGYPDGKKRRFIEGQVHEVDEVYADLLIAKGLAREPDPVDVRPAKRGKAQ